MKRVRIWGMENERDIEDAGGGVTGDLAIDEVEEMLGLGEILADRRQIEAVAEAVLGDDDDGGFRAEREGDGLICLKIRLADLGAVIV